MIQNVSVPEKDMADCATRSRLLATDRSQNIQSFVIEWLTIVVLISIPFTGKIISELEPTDTTTPSSPRMANVTSIPSILIPTDTTAPSSPKIMMANVTSTPSILEPTDNTTSASPKMANVTSTSSTEEQVWKQSLDVLEKQVVVYENTSKQGDDEATVTATMGVAEAMRRVGDSFIDPEVKRKWHDWANKFSIGHPEERESTLVDAKKGLFLLIATPFAVVGASIFAVGAMLYGAGLVVKSLGNVATCGFFNRRKSSDSELQELIS
jgi:hypothetical protein